MKRKYKYNLLILEEEDKQVANGESFCKLY